VAKDPDKAMGHYRKAADRGNAIAMHNLAMLEATRGDLKAAAAWFLKAASYGVSGSQFRLAVLYFQGTGVERDPREAYIWFALAAKRGDHDARDRRNDLARSLSPEQLKAAEAAVGKFVVEAQPDEAFGPREPVGGWDLASRDTTAPADAGHKAPPATDPALVKQAAAEVPASEDLPDGIGGPKLRSAALQGDPTAAYEVGRRFASGKGVALNCPSAARWFQRAEKAGVIPASLQLGVLHESGQGVTKDTEKARWYFLKAARRGNAEAMHHLGGLYADRIDFKNAEKWFLKAAEHGVRDSQYRLGSLYFDGPASGGLTTSRVGLEPDLALAYKWFSIAAQQGDDAAKHRLDELAAKMSASSIEDAQKKARSFVVEPQPQEAFRVPTPSGGWDEASRHDADASAPEMPLGCGLPVVATAPDASAARAQPSTSDSAGVTTDPARPTPAVTTPPAKEDVPDAIAGPKLQSAALKGDRNAAYEVGLRFLKPEHQDYLQAAKWFERAEQAGLVPASFQLGVLFEKGLGVARDTDKAIGYYRKAAEGGNAAAMHNLASLEADRSDLKTAAPWFLKAARRGVVDSQFSLAVLYFRGTGVERDFREAYKWFALAADRGDRDAKDRRDDLARWLPPEELKAADAEVRSFVPEPQPDEVVSVPAPAGGWDLASADTSAAQRAPTTSDSAGVKTDPARPTPAVTTQAAKEDLPDAIAGPKLRVAALAGDRNAAYEVGLRFLKPEHQDYLQAAKWFERAEQAGLVPASFQLGVMFERGLGVARDTDKAIGYYRKAAERGNAAAMHNLASLEAARGDLKTAAPWFLKAAKCGFVDSQFNLAVLHFRGRGVERDPREAYKWFALAAKQGDRDAKDRRDNLARSLSPEQLKAANAEVRSFVPSSQPDEVVRVPSPVGGWDSTLPDPTVAPADAGHKATDPASVKPTADQVPVSEDLPDAIGGPKLRSAALAGDPAAAYEVGLCFAQGKGVPRNDAQAVRWLTKAELAGLAPATFQLGLLYENGQDPGRDLEKARQYYLKAAERGSAAAMHRLGRLDADKGDATSAAEWFLKAARLGVVESQFNLGVLYYEGVGVPRDFALSYRWFALAATQGDRDATQRMNDVRMLLNAQSLKAEDDAVRSFVVEPQPAEALPVPVPAGGQDGPSADAPARNTAGATDKPASAPATMPVPANDDLPDAITSPRLRTAALAGDPTAAYEVGLRFLNGSAGLERDYLRAAKWFERAEQAGLTPAAFQLGVLYQTGQGVTKDPEKERQYFRKAAEHGNAAAMHNLAVIEADRGDNASAAQWFIKAANHGVTDSQFNLAELYFRGFSVERSFVESYKWFALAAARGDHDAQDRRNDVATRLNDAERKAAEEAVKRFVVEPQPTEAFSVPTPARGWDDVPIAIKPQRGHHRHGPHHR